MTGQPLLGQVPWERPSRCLGVPRLRKDWEDIECECLLGGRATVWETLWVVIFTMGVASMRDQEMLLPDLEWYVLHFFVLWGIFFVSLDYATRFNDEDAFHSLFWAGFLFGMLGLVVHLNHDLAGLAACAALLHALVAAADLRVAAWLPRARPFCLFKAAGLLVSAALFAVLATKSHAGGMERAILWAYVGVEPLRILAFLGVAWSAGQLRGWDVPMSLEHMVHRLQGAHMMIIVCSFLFPIALQGDKFCSSWSAAACVLLANVYAVCLKLIIFDTSPFQHTNDKEALQLHAIRRSRTTALLFTFSYPLTMLGIALAGVGFVAAINSKDESMVRARICGGTALWLGTLALHKALHKAVKPRVHVVKAALVGGAACACLVIQALALSALATLGACTAAVALALASELGAEAAMAGQLRDWKWKAPRLSIDWQEIKAGKQVGANVTSQEHLFTVLVAVAVFQLTELLQSTHDLEGYVLQYLVFFCTLSSSFAYASRFNDEDASHKILWSLYQFCLLMMLEGAGSASSAAWSVFKLSTVAMFLLVSIGFFGRIALAVPRARLFASYFAGVNFLVGLLFLLTCLGRGQDRPIIWVCVGLCLLSDGLLAGLMRWCTADRRQVDVPMNIEYIVARYDGLLIEVLGVAVIVPNAHFPGAYAHSWHVAAGDLLVAATAACLKIGLFDVEPISLEQHAIRRSQLSAILFMLNNIVTNLAICALGAGMAMLIPACGRTGNASRSPFAQRILCGALCLFWGSLTFTKLLHKPRLRHLHMIKVVVQALGALASLLPLLLPGTTDMAALTAAVGAHAAVVFAQLAVNALGPPARQAVPEPEN